MCRNIETAAFRELVDAARYADMPEFLEAMRMGGEGDVLLPNGNPADGAVRLATLHGAKGLEFPVVFLYGINDKLLPLAAGEETDTEEERRLFYVGITRAKEELILTTSGEPSPFLSAIAGLKRERSVPKTEYRQLALF